LFGGVKRPTQYPGKMTVGRKMTESQESAHFWAPREYQQGGGGLCLLSLDGGGVRGISSLVILRRLMRMIDPSNELRPCDVFDMIGGTSTGGLVSLKFQDGWNIPS